MAGRPAWPSLHPILAPHSSLCYITEEQVAPPCTRAPHCLPASLPHCLSPPAPVSSVARQGRLARGDRQPGTGRGSNTAFRCQAALHCTLHCTALHTVLHCTAHCTTQSNFPCTVRALYIADFALQYMGINQEQGLTTASGRPALTSKICIHASYNNPWQVPGP